MKIALAFLLNVAVVAAMCGNHGGSIETNNNIRGSVFETSDEIMAEEEEYYTRVNVESRDLVALDHPSATGCIQTKDGRTTNGNSFVLGDCSNDETSGVDTVYLFTDYTGDQIGLLRLRADPTKCMQATHGGVLVHGAWMRVYPCDCTNPLQRFHLQSLHLQDTDWCVAHLGNVVDHYEDHLMLKNCSDISYGWSED